MNLETFENKENIKVVETVRVALYHKGEFLLLQKTANSKNPGALEFPGGKVEPIKGDKSTEEEQIDAAMKEVEEETGLDIQNLKKEKIKKDKDKDFVVYFQVPDKDNPKIINKYKRIVYLFLVRLPDNTNRDLITVNRTKNEQGGSEDNHEKAVWVNADTLIKSATVLIEKPNKKNDTEEIVDKNIPEVEKSLFYPLARNSRYLKELLIATGDLKPEA